MRARGQLVKCGSDASGTQYNIEMKRAVMMAGWINPCMDNTSERQKNKKSGKPGSG